MTTLQERQQAFEQSIRGVLGDLRDWKVNRAYGMSSAARVLERGLLMGGLNLDKLDAGVRGWLVLTVLRFAPSDEVWLGFAVQKDIGSAVARVLAMNHAGCGDRGMLRAGDELEYSHRSNLVSAYLARGGRLLLRNKRFWEAVPEDPTPFGPAAELDHVFLSVNPGSPAGTGAGAAEFVRHIESLVTPSRLTVLGDAVAPRIAPVPDLQSARARFDRSGGTDPDGLFERLFVALEHADPIRVAVVAGCESASFAPFLARFADATGLELGALHSEPEPLVAAIEAGDASDTATLQVVDLDTSTALGEAMRWRITQRRITPGPRPAVRIVATTSAPTAMGLESLAPAIRARPLPLGAAMDSLGLDAAARAWCQLVFPSHTVPDVDTVARAVALRGALAQSAGRDV